MFHGLSTSVCIMWLLVFPGSAILATIFFKTKTWQNIINYYSEWLDPEDPNQ